jgi:hypothetical protein
VKKLVALVAALAAFAFAATAGATPGETPHGSIGACNGMASSFGMDNAVNHANENGLNGMVRAIENTSPYGPPDFCPNP